MMLIMKILKNNGIKWNWSTAIIIICLIAFGAGYLLAKCTNDNVQWDDKINPLHALSIVSSVLIAIFISIFFNTKQESKKNKKSFYYERLKRVESYVQEYAKLLSEEKILLQQVTSINKKIGTFKTELNKKKEKVNFIPLKDLDIFFDELETQLKLLRDLSTNTTELNKMDIYVENNHVNYSKKRKEDLELILEKIDFILFDLRMSE